MSDPDWVVAGLESDHEKTPFVLLEDFLKDSWSLPPPVDRAHVRFKYWDGYGDYTIKVVDGGTTPMPWNIGWTLYKYEAFALIHVFARHLDGTFPQGLYMIRHYIEKLIGQFPTAMHDKGVYSIQTASIMPGTDDLSKQEVPQQTIFHQVFKVRMIYAKADLHDRSQV